MIEPDYSQPATVIQDTRDIGAIFVHSEVDDAALTPIEFRVYAHLARRAGAQGAYPGIDSMCRVCQVGPSTIIRSIRELERRRMITVHRTEGQRNRYVLTRRSSWLDSTVSVVKGVSPQKRTSVTTETVPVSPQKRKVLHKGNPSKVIQADTDFPDALKSEDFLAAWNEWKEHRKHKRQSLTPEATKRQLTKLSAMGKKRAIAAINFSIEQGYTGVFEEQRKNGAHPDNPKAVDRSKIDLPERFKSWAATAYPDKRAVVMKWQTWADVPNSLREEWWRQEKRKLPIGDLL